MNIGLINQIRKIRETREITREERNNERASYGQKSFNQFRLTLRISKFLSHSPFSYLPIIPRCFAGVCCSAAIMHSMRLCHVSYIFIPHS